MDIIEARELLGVSEYAELNEIKAANDKNIERAIMVGDVALFKLSGRAVAELLVESKRFSRTQADQYIWSQEQFIAGVGAEECRDQPSEELAQAEAAVESARVTLTASANARIERRNASRQSLSRLFSFQPRS